MLAGLLLAARARGRSVLAGIAAGLVVVSVDRARLAAARASARATPTLVASIPASAGRLSYPIGYWNALGSMAAMAVPLLVWLASVGAGDGLRPPLALAAMPPVLLAAYMTSSRGALIAAALGAGGA